MGSSASHPTNFISRDSESPYSSSSPNQIARMLSLPVVYHPSLCNGDSDHLVSLTSTTYGSLVLLDHPIANPNPNPSFKHQDFPDRTTQMVNSGSLSKLEDPLSPDSVIDTWELMEGLDDDFDSSGESPRNHNSRSSDSTGYVEKEMVDLVRSYEFVEHKDCKPLWEHLSVESLVADTDPNVVFPRKSPNEIGPSESVEHSIMETNCVLSPKKVQSMEQSRSGIVLYYTSLRGIRKTYEDCCDVRVIFRGFGVCVDERDISMDSSYRKELRSAMGGNVVQLPRVFINGKRIGGAEEIRQLNESGELAKLLHGFPLKDNGSDCGSCGDARFVPCPNCNGSCKVFEEEECRQMRCPDCNENGLIRCPGCCP